MSLTNDDEFDDEETCKQSVNKNIDQKCLIDEMVDNKQVNMYYSISDIVNNNIVGWSINHFNFKSNYFLCILKEDWKCSWKWWKFN